MIKLIPAKDLKRGDQFSTDGYVVQSAATLYDGRISLSLWLDASGGITKSAVLDGDEPCPIWTKYRYVVTSELREGDIVVEHGLRCLIDRPLQTSRNHGPARDGSVCRFTQALVLNRDDVPTEVVPRGWTADWDRNRRGDDLPHDGEHRWTIQGNDLARWSVEA